MSTYGGSTPSSRTPSTSRQSALVPFSERPRSLNRQVVLEEEEYTEALSHIIARDFFPSLTHLDATNSFLSAMESGDQSEIDATVRRMEALTEPTPRAYGQTPRASFPTDTPVSSSSRPAKRQKLTHEDVYGNVGLDSFQAKFTSEDNASFVDILKEENVKRKERYAWAWNAEERAKQKRIEAAERRTLLIGGPQAKEDTKLITQGEEGWTTERTVLTAAEEEEQDDADDEESVLAMVLENPPEGAVAISTSIPSGPLPPEPESEPSDKSNILSRPRDIRSASVPQWSFKNRNTLMFAPDADVSPHDPLPPPVVAGDTTAAGREPKGIRHGATRMPGFVDEDERAAMEPPSPSRSRIDAAIAGTPYRPSNEGPTVSSYPLVDAIPSPTPDQLGPARLKQLMTWGTLAATPRALPTSGEEPVGGESPFRIAPPTPRDNIARRLAGGASKSLREKAAMYNSGGYSRTPGPGRTPGTRGSMPPPSSSYLLTPKREDNLSPAGRLLLNKTGPKQSSLGNALGTAAKRRAEVMSRGADWDGAVGRGLSGDRRWTPSPSPRRARED